MKIFWLWKDRSRQIHQELLVTLGSDAYSEDSMQLGYSFPIGDTNLEDISRPGRPLTDLVDPFCLFL
jgi:hypothetical protein